MNIALISESPTVATGFGVNCRHLVQLLTEAGHQVVCFGVCAREHPFDPAAYPCRIVPMPTDQRAALPLLADFLQTERPDLLLVHYDLAAAGRFIEAARAAGWHGPIITHVVLDGIPFDQSALAVLHSVNASITPTYAAATYLRSQGVAHVLAAPHPVDRQTFRPLPERAALRQAAGLAGHFVVGVFGRNVERKQQPRVMLALQQLKLAGQADDLLLYLHCQPQRESPWLNSWNLEAVAQQLAISAQVLFPQAGFRQLAGIPYQRTTDAVATTSVPTQPGFPATYSYVERLNCCDLVVNVPYAGAFELVALEAQACGVPVAVTNDQGAMAEVVGQSALLLDAIDVGIHSSGGWQHFVAPATIAAAIQAVRYNPELRAELIANGHTNAARYTLAPLRQALNTALATVQCGHAAHQAHEA